MLRRIPDRHGFPFPPLAREPLDATFAAAAAGEGRAAVVEGSLSGAVDRARDAGLVALYARGDGRAQAAPFTLAVDLLGPAVARLGEQGRTAAFRGPARLAEPLFGEETVPAPSASSTLALVHGLYWLTARLADRAPLALLVDEARGADEPSLRLCAYLAQQIDELPVALVLS